MIGRRVWWCAGAVGVGIGAALLTGSGIAAADAGDSGGTHDASQQSESSGPDAPSSPASSASAPGKQRPSRPGGVADARDTVARPEALATGDQQQGADRGGSVDSTADNPAVDERRAPVRKRPSPGSRVDSRSVPAVDSQMERSPRTRVDGPGRARPADDKSEPAQADSTAVRPAEQATTTADVRAATPPATTAHGRPSAPPPPSAAIVPVADQPATPAKPTEARQLVTAKRSLAVPVANAPPVAGAPSTLGPIATVVLNLLTGLGWSPHPAVVAIFPALAPWSPTYTAPADIAGVSSSSSTGVTGVKVGHAPLEIPCGPEGYTAPADWYFPTQADGTVAANGVVWLQHGFLANKAFYSVLAATIAQQTNSIVVAPTLTSFPLACHDCWLGGDAMRLAAADMFLGDRAALNASAAAAGFPGILPSEFILTGHSMGGGFAAEVAGYAVDNHSANGNLLGVVMFDGVSDTDIFKQSLAKLDTLGIPVYQIGAPAQTWNDNAITTIDLAAARPGQFVGVDLANGSHVDSMLGTNLLVDFFGQLVTQFSPPGNTQAVFTLTAGWINDMYVGAGPDNPQFGIYGQPGQQIVMGEATAIVLGVPAPPAPGPATNSSFILEAFGFRWNERPHRINKIGASLDGTEGQLTLEGGSWADGSAASDAPTWQLGYSAVTSPNLLFVQGETSTLTLTGDPASATATISVPRALLPGATSYAVFLRGFDLDTDITHQDGFTVRGLGAEVSDLAVGDEDLTFQARLSMAAGAVPDRIQHLSLYRATGRIQYTIVGILDGAATAQTVTSTTSYSAGILNPDRPHAPQTVTIAGEPGRELGFAALTGFQFQLNPDSWLFPGRYMREISIRTYDFDYAPSTGRMTFSYDGHFSNSGLISWGLVTETQASFVLIQAADGSIERETKSGVADGLHTFVPLD